MGGYRGGQRTNARFAGAVRISYVTGGITTPMSQPLVALHCISYEIHRLDRTLKPSLLMAEYLANEKIFVLHTIVVFKPTVTKHRYFILG